MNGIFEVVKQQLMAEGWTYGGFAKRMRRIFRLKKTSPGLRWESEEELMSDCPPIDFVPDFWKLDEPERTVTILEVEDKNTLSDIKMMKLTSFWFYMDCEEWDVELIVTDRYGKNRREIALQDHYYVSLYEAVAKRRKEMQVTP